MLDFDTVLELMKKYGFSSTSVHPYIYKNGEVIGICYSYIDEDFGTLERVRYFNSLESLEMFLKELVWVKDNGKNYNVRMILDNYEINNPKVLFLRNEKLMLNGEMFDIESFERREVQRKQMDEVSEIIYEAGDLFLIYNELKERQLLYLNGLVGLKNFLRKKYFDLQKEIDIYNNYNVERNLTLLPEVPDSGGINEVIETGLKDRYNMYIAQRPSLEEATNFLKEVWDLNMSLESNTRYYEAQREENDIRNEIKIVEHKLNLMKKLNENNKSFFGIDLVSRFRKINKECMAESISLSNDYIVEKLDLINKKYSVYDKLELIYVSEYLREAFQNTNYEELALKYAKGVPEENLNKAKMPLNEVAVQLFEQYRDKLSIAEQNILVLYNNYNFRRLCNAILEIDDFEKINVIELVKRLKNIKGFSKLKTECYETIRKRIDNPVNERVKKSVFANFNFETFDTFISSLVNELVTLKNINNKIIINSDIKMYFLVNNLDDINNKKFILLTNDLNTLYNEVVNNKDSKIGIVSLKEKTPILYSPYYLDLGNLYSKEEQPLMEIKEMINFEVLIKMANILVNTNQSKINIVRYSSNSKVEDNITYVDDIKFVDRIPFCNFTFVGNNIYNEEIVPAKEIVNVSSKEEIKTNNNDIKNIDEKTTNIVSKENVDNSLKENALKDKDKVNTKVEITKKDEKVISNSQNKSKNDTIQKNKEIPAKNNATNNIENLKNSNSVINEKSTANNNVNNSKKAESNTSTSVSNEKKVITKKVEETGNKKDNLENKEKQVVKTTSTVNNENKKEIIANQSQNSNELQKQVDNVYKKEEVKQENKTIEKESNKVVEQKKETTTTIVKPNENKENATSKTIDTKQNENHQVVNNENLKKEENAHNVISSLPKKETTENKSNVDLAGLALKALNKEIVQKNDKIINDEQSSEKGKVEDKK